MAGDMGGPFTGLYQGASGAADAAAALRPLLPNTTVYQNGPSTAPQLQNQITTPPASSGASSGGALQQFGHFLGNVASETGNIAGSVAKWLGTQAVNAVEAPVKLGEGLGHGLIDRMTLSSINSQNQQISARLQSLHSLYKTGQINTQQFQLGMKSLNQDSQNLINETNSVSSRATFDQKATTNALINTASDLVLILSAGTVRGATVNITGQGLKASGTQSAANWLGSEVAAPMLTPVSDTISKLATNSRAFQALDHITQNVLQKSTAEVIGNAASNMTSTQLARATAVNLALKSPIYFNYMSSTADQVYKELDQAKYGDAIRTLAFNAALVLSGGPIGQALKYGGSALKGLSERTFGQASFWDELSKFYGDQTPAGFATTISKMANDIKDPGQRAEFIKNLAAIEATNTAATGGDAIAAASRVAKGMQGSYGFDLTQVSHEQAITDMVNFAKNFRIANDTAQKLGLGTLAIGRVDARDLNLIADKLAATDNFSSQMEAWQSLKTANPNQAWANNANFDKQVTNIISSSGNIAELAANIKGIKAQFSVRGFPEPIAKKMAKDGYFPIKPSNIEAPFKEGSDKLLTAHTTGQDFFTKAVQPLPVLQSVGALFTKLGLSPVASSAKTYEYFNDYVAKNLASSGVIDQTLGEDIHATADTLVKKLSDYAHGLKVPVTDLRMMTNKQIRTALNVGFGDATKVQQSIVDAYIKVPLAVRGMGDKAVDWTYKGASGIVARRYLRIQGALRFSFNPFFQYLRVIPKTEMLSEAEGGGFLSSIFSGRASQISDIRQGLRGAGFFDQPGSFGNVVTGEELGGLGATEFNKNLSKRLLPMQERSIAGLIDSQSQRMGMDWKQYISEYPQQARDTVQMITEYDRNSQYLNSAFARTLNVAVFPSRFDTKVAMIMGRSLARSSTLTQVSFINGLMKAQAWLTSPEGQAWYAQNSDAIKVFSYITPLLSMSETISSLMPGHDHSLGNFGELGGLPFGWIPQILDAEGLTHFNQPGVDAKTGQVIPNYIPATTKGQAAIAIQDLLGSIFSYPGATVGLPSKTAITRTAALGLVGGSKTKDLTKVTPSLAPDQQHYQQTIESDNGTGFGNAVLNNNPGSPGTTQVSPSSTTPDIAASVKPKTKSTKLKKAQFPVMLPPGQSQAGVL